MTYPQQPAPAAGGDLPIAAAAAAHTPAGGFLPPPFDPSAAVPPAAAAAIQAFDVAALAGETPPAPAAASAGLSAREKLHRARLPETTVRVCTRGDLQATWEELEHQLEQAQQYAANDPRLAGGKAELRRLAQQIRAVEEEMADHTIVFHLRALPRVAWQQLVQGHPPRPDNADDERLGYNPDEMFTAAVRACTVAPADLTDEDWSTLFDEVLTERQWVNFQLAVMKLNTRQVDVPSSFAASQILSSEGE